MSVEKKDGGWGWVVVVGQLYNLCIYASCVRCYSVFYRPLMSAFDMNYADVAWLNASFQMGYGITSACSPFILRHFGIRQTVMTCGLVGGTSCLIASCMPQFWQIQIFMGAIGGVVVCPSIMGGHTIVTHYFNKRLYRAMQITALGWSIGPFAFCLLYQVLIDTYSWRGAIQIISGLFLNIAVSGSLMRPNDTSVKYYEGTKRNEKKVVPSTTRRRSSVKENAIVFAHKADLAILKNPLFYLYCFSWNGFGQAYYTTIIYLIPYGQSELNFDVIAASSLVSAIAVGELLSKFMFGIVMDKIPSNKRLHVIVGLFVGIAITLLIMSRVTSYGGLIALCATLGFFGGGMSGIFNGLIVEIFDIRVFSAVMGYSGIIIHSLGTLFTVLIGLAIDRSGSFVIAFYIGATMVATSIPCCLLLKFFHERKLSRTVT